MGVICTLSMKPRSHNHLAELKKKKKSRSFQVLNKPMAHLCGIISKFGLPALITEFSNR